MPGSASNVRKASLWELAKQRFIVDLHNQHSDLYLVMFENASQATILAGTKAQGQAIADHVKRLELPLKVINDFVSGIEMLCGADTNTSAAIWGSIQLILSVS